MCYRSSTSYAPRKKQDAREVQDLPPQPHMPPPTTLFIQVTRRTSLIIQSPFHNYMLILNYFHAHRAPRYQDYRYASSTHPGVWSNKEMILPALGIFTICLLILMFPSATGLVCQKMYSEVHNLAFQGPSWDIDKKFGTEPIAQERCFTKSSRWFTVLSGSPRSTTGYSVRYMNRWKLPRPKFAARK